MEWWCPSVCVRPVQTHKYRMEAVRNFRFDGNICLTHVTDTSCSGLRSRGPAELSNRQCITTEVCCRVVDSGCNK